MEKNTIQPDRITKPFQLLAAWLVGLIVVNASFLGAASLISIPYWGPNALIIASIANVPLFIGSIFLLQTKFRPEMQTDDYYADHLRRQLELKQTELLAQKEIKEQVKQDVEKQIQEVANINDIEERKIAIDKVVDSLEEFNLITKYYNSIYLPSFYKYKELRVFSDFGYFLLRNDKDVLSIITEETLYELNSDGLIELKGSKGTGRLYRISDLGIKVYKKIEEAKEQNRISLRLSDQITIGDE